MNIQNSLPLFKRTVIAVAVSTAFLTPATAAAPGTLIGPSVTVSQGTAPAVASNAAGEYVVVWVPATDWTTPNASIVMAQRYTAASVPIGQPFVVSSRADADPRIIPIQFAPRVAMDQEGDFTVSWGEFNLPLLLGNSANKIYVRHFAAGGTATGNDVLLGQGDSADVAMDPDGDAVVVWNSFTTTSTGIRARRFGRTGAPAGQAVQVATRLSVGLPRFGGRHFLINPAVTMDPAGEFTVAWDDEHLYVPRDSDNFGATHSISARRFGINNKPLTGELQVNDPAEFFSMASPLIANDASGNFTVLWTSGGSRFGNGPTGYARSFRADGTPRSAPIVVTTPIANDGGSETIGSVVSDEPGNFTVVSSDYFVEGSNRSSRIRLRSYTPEGALRGGPLTVIDQQVASRSQSLARDAAGVLTFVQSRDGNYFEDIIAQRIGGF